MLITSISGIRGTIGGIPGENLTPIDVVSFISAYGQWINSQRENATIIIGRDARASGEMFLNISISTLTSLGINVINTDLAATPTVAMEVTRQGAQGGIIITASHNPKEYNGIKMLDEKGEFLSAQQGQELLDLIKVSKPEFSIVEQLGKVKRSYDHTRDHINDILDLDLVDAALVKKQNYTIAVDAINSVGGIAVPMLLEKMGVTVIGLHCEPHGDFQHAPEPVLENLHELVSLVGKTQADLGIAVDPDVDRLVLVNNHGKMFGEEYTIVSIADYVLSETPGNTVSNLSSSRALEDVAATYDVNYYPSAVGEKNVVEKMKEVNAVIGGEGSGGVIYPELHYGRDALVGIALFLTSLAKKSCTVAELRGGYNDYFMSKQKISLPSLGQVEMILSQLAVQYAHNHEVSAIDGVRVDFDGSWVHVRASNTEPILRIISEHSSQEEADASAQKMMDRIQKLL